MMDLGMVVFTQNGDVSEGGAPLTIGYWLQVMDIQQVQGCDLTTRVSATPPESL
jgi:hypothetical protein